MLTLTGPQTTLIGPRTTLIPIEILSKSIPMMELTESKRKLQ